MYMVIGLILVGAATLIGCILFTLAINRLHPAQLFPIEDNGRDAVNSGCFTQLPPAKFDPPVPPRQELQQKVAIDPVKQQKQQHKKRKNR